MKVSLSKYFGQKITRNIKKQYNIYFYFHFHIGSIQKKITGNLVKCKQQSISNCLVIRSDQKSHSVSEGSRPSLGFTLAKFWSKFPEYCQKKMWNNASFHLPLGSSAIKSLQKKMTSLKVRQLNLKCWKLCVKCDGNMAFVCFVYSIHFLRLFSGSFSDVGHMFHTHHDLLA